MYISALIFTPRDNQEFRSRKLSKGEFSVPCARSSRAVPDNNKAESNDRCHNNITLRHKASSATVGLELQASASASASCFAFC